LFGFLELGAKLSRIRHYWLKTATLVPDWRRIPQHKIDIGRQRLARSGTFTAIKTGVHSTFFQKVIICAFAGFLAASLIEWAKVFVEGADDALNKGYKHHAVLDTSH
jgi:hypothetical protein